MTVTGSICLDLAAPEYIEDRDPGDEHAYPSCRDAQCWQRDPSIVEWHHPIVDSASTMNITGCACGWRPRVYSWRHIPGELSQNDVDDQYARYLALAKNSPPHARGCDIHSGEECSHEPGCPRDR